MKAILADTAIKEALVSMAPTSHGREVYIIAGGAGSQGGFKGIDIPESTWKVIVALERGKSFPEGRRKRRSSP